MVAPPSFRPSSREKRSCGEARRTSEAGAPILTFLFHRQGCITAMREKEGERLERERKRGRKSERRVTHRLWILMTRAMNSDRAKGGTALCGKPTVLPCSCLRRSFSSSSFTLFFLPSRLSLLVFLYPPSCFPTCDLSITFSLFLGPVRGR